MTSLRQVLQVFEETPIPLSVQQVARQLAVDSGILEDMIRFWVHKGELREAVLGQGCSSCGSAKGCPFVMPLPPHYERVRDYQPEYPSICTYRRT